jgi:acyl-CoA thioesterase-1
MNLFRTSFVAAASRRARTRSYGDGGSGVQTPVAAAGLALVCIAWLFGGGLAAQAQDPPVKLVAFGDSLSAGLGLPAAEAFPAKLAQALKAKGLNVEVADAGVSGDTTSAGLGRLDWSIPDGTDAVIVELGANDALRGVDPKITRAALDQILRRLQERGVAVLLAGMRAPRNLGEGYAARFDPIFPELAAAHGALLYPFFLDGVATDAKLNQRDGMHPNAQGVDAIVARILPKVEELVARVRAKSRS